jgi:PAS domain S-box-containing protein
MTTASQETRAARAQAELSLLVDMVPSHLWQLAPDGEPIFFNKRMIDFLGLDVADMEKPGMTRLEALLETIHPNDAAEFSRALTHCLATGESFAMRYRLRRADGVHRWMSTRAEPMRDEDGRIVRWYGLCQDIDDQIPAEEAIRRSEQRFQQMIDAVPVFILSFTADGVPTYINKRYQDYLGLSIPHYDSLQEQQRALIHPDDFAEMYGTLSHCFKTGVPFLLRYRRRGKDGTYRWSEGRAEPLRDQDGKIVQWYAVSLDIEDEMRAQEALRQASAKLAQATQAASLAELSASIAHEVNQPLAAIVANSHACQRWLQSDPPNMERALITVERIIRDANTAADVVSRIRALFRQDVAPRSQTSFAGVIAEARSLISEEARRRRIRMDVDVENDLPLVALDRVQVQQVLINLIRNAMDAMENTVGNRILGMRARRVENAIQIEVSDRGRGIESPDRIFEPFFTTKPNGMGMGLAICRSIVESHGGRLWVESNQPEGTTFIFTLPIEVKAVT